jgi:6-pyruvoyltetrahydropterin/6-carboxytetrahydropterin synthase
MVLTSVSRTFNAAHKLYNPDWDEQKNKEVFGPCANENWHGHNFELIVTVSGDLEDRPDAMTSRQLGAIMDMEIISHVDYKNLNTEVPFMVGRMASCENIILEFWKILDPVIKGRSSSRLYRIRLFETPRNFVDYYGQ